MSRRALAREVVILCLRAVFKLSFFRSLLRAIIENR